MAVQQVTTLHHRLSSTLGVPGIYSDRELSAVLANQLPSAAIRSLLQAGFTDSELFRLVIPRRTLAHRRAGNQPLSLDETSRAVRLARVAATAEEVFGEPDRAWRWLRKPKQQFDGKPPMDMLATEAGARTVEELLSQIEYGAVA